MVHRMNCPFGLIMSTVRGRNYGLAKCLDPMSQLPTSDRYTVSSSFSCVKGLLTLALFSILLLLTLMLLFNDI